MATNYIKCNICEKEKALNNYYTYYGDNFKALNEHGKYCTCKDCLQDEYKKTSGQDRRAGYIFALCQQMNKPYIDEIYNECIKESLADRSINPLKSYFKKISGAKYNRLSFVDGDLSYIERDINKINEKGYTQEVYDKWSEFITENDVDNEDSLIRQYEELFQSFVKEYEIPQTIEKIDALKNLVILKKMSSRLIAVGDTKELKNVNSSIKELENVIGIADFRKNENKSGASNFGDFIREKELKEPHMSDYKYEDVDGLLLSSKVALGSTAVAMGKTMKEEFRKVYLNKYEVN